MAVDESIGPRLTMSVQETYAGRPFSVELWVTAAWRAARGLCVSDVASAALAAQLVLVDAPPPASPTAAPVVAASCERCGRRPLLRVLDSKGSAHVEPVAAEDGVAERFVWDGCRVFCSSSRLHMRSRFAIAFALPGCALLQTAPFHALSKRPRRSNSSEEGGCETPLVAASCSSRASNGGSSSSIADDTDMTTPLSDSQQQAAAEGSPSPAFALALRRPVPIVATELPSFAAPMPAPAPTATTAVAPMHMHAPTVSEMLAAAAMNVERPLDSGVFVTVRISQNWLEDSVVESILVATRTVLLEQVPEFVWNDWIRTADGLAVAVSVFTTSEAADGAMPRFLSLYKSLPTQTKLIASYKYF